MFAATLYYPVYLGLVTLMTLVYANILSKQSNHSLIEGKKDLGIMGLWAVVFILLVGLRPLSGRAFGDTVNYARSYYAYQTGAMVYDSGADSGGEWVFSLFMYWCSQRMSVNMFFLLVEIGYVAPLMVACRRLIPNRADVALLFCMSAFSFFTYGVNGIRNGWACSLVILAFSYVRGSNKEKILAAVLCFLAYNIHHSTALPILCLLVSPFVRNIRFAIGFWVASIFVSLVAGGAVENFFTSFGFDDRMVSYGSANIDEDMFSDVGFRWDFLLYSAMPIWLGWYVVQKRGAADANYKLLVISYILCNAFWVMMIRASYSNRFAYLSWFLYPIVLAYPVLRLDIFRRQGRAAALVLFAHTAFTACMWLIGK